MANVQLEKGYTRIANELLDALMLFDFSRGERATIDCIIRLTFGFQKKRTQISLGEIARRTGLHRVSVTRIIKRLLFKRVLGRQKTQGQRTVDILWINKDYATWAINTRANSTINTVANRSINTVVTTLKKERNNKEIVDFKKSFIKKHLIN